VVQASSAHAAAQTVPADPVQGSTTCCSLPGSADLHRCQGDRWVHMPCDCCAATAVAGNVLLTLTLQHNVWGSVVRAPCRRVMQLCVMRRAGPAACTQPQACSCNVGSIGPACGGLYWTNCHACMHSALSLQQLPRADQHLLLHALKRSWSPAPAVPPPRQPAPLSCMAPPTSCSPSPWTGPLLGGPARPQAWTWPQ
jgi:hypothetical protein